MRLCPKAGAGRAISLVVSGISRALVLRRRIWNVTSFRSFVRWSERGAVLRLRPRPARLIAWPVPGHGQFFCSENCSIPASWQMERMPYFLLFFLFRLVILLLLLLMGPIHIHKFFRLRRSTTSALLLVLLLFRFGSSACSSRSAYTDHIPPSPLPRPRCMCPPVWKLYVPGSFSGSEVAGADMITACGYRRARSSGSMGFKGLESAGPRPRQLRVSLAVDVSTWHFVSVWFGSRRRFTSHICTSHNRRSGRRHGYGTSPSANHHSLFTASSHASRAYARLQRLQYLVATDRATATRILHGTHPLADHLGSKNSTPSSFTGEVFQASCQSSVIMIILTGLVKSLSPGAEAHLARISAPASRKLSGASDNLQHLIPVLSLCLLVSCKA